MYAYNSQFPATSVISQGLNSSKDQNANVNQALHLYQRTSLQGRLGRLLSKVTRQASSLLDLNQYADRLRSHEQHFAGIQAVRISQIRGTQGKGSDFDASFAPLNERTRSRWLKIAIARMQGTPMPPVELIQVGETYFVVDGHHRISVAKAFGEQMVDAEVVTWSISGALPWQQESLPARLSAQPASISG